MDKNVAKNVITNAGMNTYDIAHSIYLATVLGVSGANQNEGYGFALSAVAELWNIRGAIGNPNARTRITGRYKGMGVTEDMIMNVISQHPKGFSGYTPNFDDLLGIGNGNINNYQSQSKNINQGATNNSSDFPWVISLIAFAVLKFGMGWGWLLSIVAACFIAGLIQYFWENRR